MCFRDFPLRLGLRFWARGGEGVVDRHRKLLSHVPCPMPHALTACVQAQPYPGATWYCEPKFRWLKRAAQQHEPEAAFFLGDAELPLSKGSC